MTLQLPDRRTHPRRGVGEHQIVSARVRPGHGVTVVDISDGGALIDISKRLLPGTMVDLQLGTPQLQTRVRGRVLRCVVIEVRSSFMSYRAAIVFEYPVPAGERLLVPIEGVGPSREGL
jgi:hypothetical protein